MKLNKTLPVAQRPASTPRSGMAGPAILPAIHAGQRSVLVIQRRLTHYRVAFFEALKSELAKRDWTLRLAHGVGTTAEAVKNDDGVLPWAERLETRYLAGGRVCWQPFSHLIRDASMVVVTPENKLINNLPLQFGRPDLRVGLWGHGANLQGHPHSLRERFKRIVARRSDWWFGYTQMSVPFILKSGFPENRITVLDNAVDTGELEYLQNRLTVDHLDSLRKNIGLTGNCVGIFIGSLYEEKRIGFMLETAEHIKKAVPEFEFLIVGDGPDRPLVEAFCYKHQWIKYLGVRKGLDKVSCIALARVMINPGLVGLGILDSFVLNTPMLTTDCGLHSPEIAYLESGVNGVMTANTVEAYSAAVAATILNEKTLEALRAGCRVSAEKYTIENMAVNFADGVEQCTATASFR